MAMTEEGTPLGSRRQELLRQRRSVTLTPATPTSAAAQEPSGADEAPGSPLVAMITDAGAKQTASRIHALLERSCSNEAQRSRVLSAAAARACSPDRKQATSVLIHGPRILELAKEVQTLHQKLDVLKEHLGQGVKDAFECADSLETQVVALAEVCETHEGRLKSIEAEAAEGGRGSGSTASSGATEELPAGGVGAASNAAAKAPPPEQPAEKPTTPTAMPALPALPALPTAARSGDGSSPTLSELKAWCAAQLDEMRASHAQSVGERATRKARYNPGHSLRLPGDFLRDRPWHMNYAFTMMNYVFKWMNSALKMMTSAFKMMNSALQIQRS